MGTHTIARWCLPIEESTELPVTVDQRKTRGLAVHHLSWWRILTAAIVLLTSTPLIMLDSPLLDLVQHEIVNVMGMAGMRGLLLGVALGTVITAIRILVISDRPHSEF